jgi:hypothetical protein
VGNPVAHPLKDGRVDRMVSQVKQSGNAAHS